MSLVRINAKSAHDFRAACIALFGERGWQIGCARFLRRPDGSHVNVRTVRRWAKGESEVPVAVSMLLAAELERRAAPCGS